MTAGGRVDRGPDHLSRLEGPGGAASLSSGARQLFPLPKLPGPERAPHRCRRTCRRRAEAGRLASLTNEAIAALNYMSGFVDETGGAPRATSEMQREVIARTEDLARLVMRAHPDAPSQRAAYMELLRGKAGYDLDFAGTTLSPFHIDRVSLPSDLSGAPNIVGVPGDADRTLVEVEAQPFLRDPAEVGEWLAEAPREPYTDPALSKHPRVYGQFLKKLDALGPLR